MALWLRDLVEKTETRLAVPPAEAEYTRIERFARDGQALYFSFNPRGRVDGRLYRAPLIGGDARLVHAGGWGITLSPDDKRVAFARTQEGGDRLYVADADGGREKQVADVGLGYDWSPDGSRLLFSRRREGKDTLFDRDTQLFDLDLATGEARQIGSRVWGQISALRWLPDGSGFVVQGWISGEDHTLWLVSYPDGATRKLPDDSNGYQGSGMTADGAKLVSVQSVRRSEILVSKDPASRPFQRIKSGTGDDYRLCWTADGKLGYSSREGGSYDLYVSDPDGPNRKQLTYDRGSNETEPTASPDGRYIVFASDRSGEWWLYRINRDGSGLLSLTPAPEPHHGDRDPHITPDSRWVLYRHGDNGATLWKVPIEGGRPVLVKGVRPALPNGLVEEAFGGAASPDGRFFAFLYFSMDPKGGFSPVDLVVSGLDGEILKRFAYRTTSLGAIADEEHVQWTRDGSALHYADFENAHDLWRQPLAGGPPVRVAHLDEPPSYCDWSFDDKAVACSRSSTLSDVVLIANFH